MSLPLQRIYSRQLTWCRDHVNILRSLPLNFVVKCERRQIATNKVSVQELMGSIKHELEAYEQAMKGRDVGTRFEPNISRRTVEIRKPATASSLTTSGRRLDRLAPCAFCGGLHRHAECHKFTTSSGRRDALRKSSRCFKCLGNGHMSTHCPQQFRSCPKCKGPHHVTLCDRKVERVDVKFTSTFDGSRILLQTLSLRVKGEKRDIQVRVVLDPGSQVSFIESDLARSAGVRRCGEGRLQIDAFGIRGVAKTYVGYSVQLQGLDSKRTLKLHLVGVPKICSDQGIMDDPRCVARLRELGHCVADESTGGNNQIRILIGSDYYWQLVTGRTECIDESLVLVETVFGWVANGRSDIPKCSHSSTMVGLTDVHCALEKFWDVEHLGIKDDVDCKDIKDDVLRQFEETIERKEDGRYVVRLPWNSRVGELRSNEVGATSRLRRLLWKLERDQKLCEQYCGAMKEYLSNGFVELVDDAIAPNGPVYYLPHHAIVKEERVTTKVRVVFDASAHESGAPSLNECLHVGPQLLPDLTSLLIRFRSYRIAFIGDIAKAFLQVSLNEQDRDAVRLLWVDDNYWTDRRGGNRVDRHRIVWRKTVVLFGASSSPFLLNATIKSHIRSYADQYPEAVFLLNSSLYVDDLIGGADSVERAFELSGQCKSILGDAKLPLRKWDSSSVELLALWKCSGEEIADAELTFDDEIGKVKVLGVRWRRASDCFTFDWQEVAEKTWTKRRMLSLMASIYDPMGFVAPYVVLMKMLMQTIWKCGLGWDERMGDEISQRWVNWLQERPLLNKVRVSRWLGIESRIRQTVSLHLFCDASALAYGAVVYIRVQSVSKVQVRLLISKSRATPIKPLTIPRLELLAVLLGCRLLRFCVQTLVNVRVDSVFGWCDSEIALYWISKEPASWKPFVSHRVREIQEIWGELSGSSWRHVVGTENPADLVSRGVSLSRLLGLEVWWSGPSWLTLGDSHWPPVFCVRGKIEEDIRVGVSIAQVRSFKEVIDYERFSSFERLLRVTAWVFRVVYSSKDFELSYDELSRAELWWIRCVQHEFFAEECHDLELSGSVKASSLLCCFDPFFDDDLIRVGGRLGFADLDYNQAHPYVLPSSGYVVELLIRWYHAKNYHVGVVETLNLLRIRYWILRGRRTVSWALRKCLICSRFKAKSFRHREAPLPAFRVTNSRAFAYTGVDFAGPLWVREDVGDRSWKTYIVLFTCAVTRAVHLELSYRMDTVSFLLALRRFFARFGVPIKLWSDNARTFGQAAKELTGLRVTLGGPEVRQLGATLGFRWKFIVERAAWWGGWWERMVGVVKSRLKRSLGLSRLRFEELQTVLLEISVVVSSRPLTFLSEGRVEGPPLTPNHFLMAGQPRFVPEDRNLWVTGSSVELRKRWRHRLHMVECIWRRWRSEYLEALQTFRVVRNASEDNPTIAVGDVVLLKSEVANRCEWPMGRIVEIFSGRDGVVRSCRLHLADGSTIRRAVRHLVPLEI